MDFVKDQREMNTLRIANQITPQGFVISSATYGKVCSFVLEIVILKELAQAGLLNVNTPQDLPIHKEIEGCEFGSTLQINEHIRIELLCQLVYSPFSFNWK